MGKATAWGRTSGHASRHCASSACSTPTRGALRPRRTPGQAAFRRPHGRGEPDRRRPALHQVAPAFKNLVEETVASGQSRIVVDLGGVTFIDSSGLGALIAALKATRQAGGDLRVADVPEQVMTVLRLTNLDRVLRAHPTVADASHDW
ncbi:MAG TPA: STAS domain-containing protein [Nocardioides sp.]|nr:STAS domain-containing protein [Nocardioides sp.]